MSEMKCSFEEEYYEEETTKEPSIMASEPHIMRPCPFCGAEARIEENPIPWLSGVAVVCGNISCFVMVSTKYMDKERAIKTWNQRA